jgi:ectoine hydroxylase-related dioxygenase (phytanoyl-CoA dioxygenase family)
MRSISDEEVETFWRDGVVCLREAVSAEWVALVAHSMEDWLASPQRFDLTQYGEEVAQARGAARIPGHGAGGSVAGRFYSGTDSWRHFAGLRRFACESPLPGLVAALLRTAKLNLYEDSILIKEPGTPDKTYFHQDISYFHVEGEQICTSWLPVDPVSEGNGGLQFIKGSHRWGKRYRPNHFVTDLPMDGTDGEVVPDFSCRPAWPRDPAVRHAAGGSHRASLPHPARRTCELVPDDAPSRPLGSLLRRRCALPDPARRATEAAPRVCK